jgi:hypothetical protein
MTSIKHEYSDIMELECVIPNVNCAIAKADSDVTSIYAEGYAEFIDLLEFSFDGMLLKVDYDRQKWQQFNTNKWYNKNIININVTSKLEKLTKIKLTINGTGDIDLKVPAENFEVILNDSGDIIANELLFDNVDVIINGSGNIDFGTSNGNVSAVVNGSGNVAFGNAGTSAESNIVVNGSGNITFNNAGKLTAVVNGSGDITFDTARDSIINVNGSGNIACRNVKDIIAGVNGSGDIKIGECGKLKLDIDGSGNFNVNKVSESVNISMRGSGKMNIKQGEVEMFNIYIEKNGAVNAKGVTTSYAKIEIAQNGKVEIGRVKVESTEICNDNAEFIIHQRGYQIESNRKEKSSE